MSSVEYVGTLANRHSVFLKRRHNLERWGVTRVWEFAEPARADLVERATAMLVAHHDGLRLQVSMEAGQLTEFLADVESVQPFLSIVIPDEHSDEDVRRLVEATAYSIVDSFTFPGELFKVVYFESRRAGLHPLIAFVTHHLLADAWSWQVMLSDFFTLYQQLASGDAPTLPTKTTPLASLARLSAAHWWRGGRERADRHWLSLPWGAVKPLPLPDEADLSQNTDEHSIRLTRVLPVPPASRRNVETARYRDTELALAAVTEAFLQWTRQSTLLLAVVVHGREPFVRNVDLTRTFGWLTEVVPILLGSSSKMELLSDIRRQLNVSQSIARSYGVFRYLSEEHTPYRELPEPQILLNIKVSSYRGAEPRVARVSERFRTRIADRSLYQQGVERPFILSGGLVTRSDEIQLSWDFSTKVLRAEDVTLFLDDCIDKYMRLAWDDE